MVRRLLACGIAVAAAVTVAVAGAGEAGARLADAGGGSAGSRLASVEDLYGTGTGQPAPGSLAAGAEDAMRRDLAGQLGVPVSLVVIVSTEAVTWADGCLGVHEPGVVCAQVLTPGFLALLAVEGLPWLFPYHGSGAWFVAAPFIGKAALSAPFKHEPTASTR